MNFEYGLKYGNELKYKDDFNQSKPTQFNQTKPTKPCIPEQKYQTEPSKATKEKQYTSINQVNLANSEPVIWILSKPNKFLALSLAQLSLSLLLFLLLLFLFLFLL